MNTKFKIVVAALLATLYVGAPAIAEDIEIYQTSNTGSSGVRPNILFILDTSGSMDDEISTTVQYDPNTDYSTLSGCGQFSSDKIYFLDSGDFLSDVTCSATFSNNSFDVGLNKCDALDYALFGLKNADGSWDYYVTYDDQGNAINQIQGAGGFFKDRFTQWLGNPKRTWSVPKTNLTQNANYIECLEDEGKHGIDDSSIEMWIDNSSGTPYSSIDTNVAWSDSMSLDTMFYSSNYAHYLIYASTGPSAPQKKIDIMRNTIISIMDGAVTGVDVGLMKFNGAFANGGTVMHPVVDISLNRQDLFATMKTWSADGSTPLSESLYEAVRYFRGDTPVYGGTGDSSMEGTTTLSGPVFDENGVESTGTRYKSPVDADAANCEAQYIIMLSDGNPTSDYDANSSIVKLDGFVGLEGTSGACDGPFGSGMCLDDLAGYLYRHGVDVALNDGGNVTSGGVSAAKLTGETAEDVKISTFTVGFDFDSDLLKNTGKAGTGNDSHGYKTAKNASDLLKVLIDLIDNIKQTNTTFSSPAVSVNAFNRTTHRSELYFTIFKPDDSPHWDGNLKRFQLDVAADGSVSIVDVNGNSAIDGITGFFRNTATSYWTPTVDAPDGSETAKGGAASKLTNTRNVYTNVSGLDDLSASGNELSETNPNIDYAMLDIPADSAYKSTLLQWARGIDVRDEDIDGDSADARRIMGDPLHAQPVLVQYGGTAANPLITAYVATNDGYLHAIDTSTGEEDFSFMPVELLPNIKVAYENNTGGKLYGLDGSITAWVNDANGDAQISGAGEHAYIYFGMRRGGRTYYALDVTNKASPRVLWKIQGGQGDFTELGYTWSNPVHRKIRLGGSDRHVIIFAGGYDNNQDTAILRSQDTMGRAVYMVDAETGGLLWKADSNTAGFSQMLYSIPSEVSAADTNGDDLIDKLYVGDMGGQIWRIDINNQAGATSSDPYSIITGGRIADLADNTTASHRRFYYAPDAALLKDRSGATYISLLITSGSRTHPLNTAVQDRMFMLKDTPVGGAPTTYETIVENDGVHDLYDTTDNIIGQGGTSQVEQAKTDLGNAKGWYINLDASVGEKGLAKPLIFAGQAFISTYIPPDPTTVLTNQCGPDEGTGFLYHIFIADGKPVLNYDQIVSADPENLTREDRRVKLAKSGIPPEPKYLRPEKASDGEDPGDCIVVGTQLMCLGLLKNKEKLYWYEE